MKQKAKTTKGSLLGVAPHHFEEDVNRVPGIASQYGV